MDDEASGNFTRAHMDPKQLILLVLESEIAASSREARDSSQ
jgi:hypothetical protein